jgi:hypothetical protein
MPFDERQSTNRQESLTVLAEIQDEPALEEALAGLSPSLFGDRELGVHFARLAIIPRVQGTERSRAWLAFESNFDTAVAGDEAARRAHLDVLAARTQGTLGRVFTCCGGLPAGASPGELADHLKRRLVPSTATYQGHGDRDIARIRLEQHLREVILTFFERADQASPQELFDRVRKHVRQVSKQDPELAGLDVDAPAPALPDPDVRLTHLHEGPPWVRTFLNPPTDLGPIAGGLAANVFRHDKVYDVREHQEAWTDADRARLSAIARTEDHGTQNALTHVVPLRAGPTRPWVLKHAHAIVDRISKAHFKYIGQLGTIPSIHFAKWLLFEEDGRLLFFSNYDKSWESYLGDFVDKAPEGLNLAWSCTEEYPRTVAFAFEGAKDEETFKAWGRAYQVPTQVFYSAYPDLTIQTINNNTWIRHRLHQPAAAGGIEAWLRRLT